MGHFALKPFILLLPEWKKKHFTWPILHTHTTLIHSHTLICMEPVFESVMEKQNMEKRHIYGKDNNNLSLNVGDAIVLQ